MTEFHKTLIGINYIFSKSVLKMTLLNAYTPAAITTNLIPDILNKNFTERKRRNLRR